MHSIVTKTIYIIWLNPYKLPKMHSLSAFFTPTTGVITKADSYNLFFWGLHLPVGDLGWSPTSPSVFSRSFRWSVDHFPDSLLEQFSQRGSLHSLPRFQPTAGGSHKWCFQVNICEMKRSGCGCFCTVFALCSCILDCLDKWFILELNYLKTYGTYSKHFVCMHVIVQDVFLHTDGK